MKNVPEHPIPIKSKKFQLVIKKAMPAIVIIWFAVIFVFGLIEPDVSIWIYFIVGAPLIVLSAFVVYMTIWVIGSSIIDWMATTSDREEIKRTIINFFQVAMVFIILFFLLYLIGG